MEVTELFQKLFQWKMITLSQNYFKYSEDINLTSIFLFLLLKRK